MEMRQIASSYPNITSLEFDSRLVDDKSLIPMLHVFRKLTLLDLTHCIDVTDVALSVISDLPHIRILKIDNCITFTPEAIIRLIVKCPQLESVDISRIVCRIKKKTLRELMQNTEQFSIPAEKIDSTMSSVLIFDTIDKKMMTISNDTFMFIFQAYLAIYMRRQTIPYEHKALIWLTQHPLYLQCLFACVLCYFSRSIHWLLKNPNKWYWLVFKYHTRISRIIFKFEYAPWLMLYYFAVRVTQFISLLCFKLLLDGWLKNSSWASEKLSGVIVRKCFNICVYLDCTCYVVASCVRMSAVMNALKSE
jgi:hypothetical protein